MLKRTALISLLLLAGSQSFTASAQQITLPLWPNGAPEQTSIQGPEHNTSTAKDVIAGRAIIRLSGVANPSLTLYKAPAANNTGAAVVVFPGGGYAILAYDLEGTEVCDWLNSIGVNCVLVKYRVPLPTHYPDSTIQLEDAQQAMRLARSHAVEWDIDPHRIGALGFSAGAHLVAVLSNHADYQAPVAANLPANVPAANMQPAQSGNAPGSSGAAANPIDARPDFAFILYPGYLVSAPDLTRVTPGDEPNANAPPTFLLQAEDDPVHEESALMYFEALKQLKVPAELHIYAQGGHGYGLRPTDLPITHWPALAEAWLRTIHILSPVPSPTPAPTTP